MRFIEGPRAPSDHRKCRELFVPVENQGSNMYPTVVAFAEMVLPSDLHAKSKPAPNVAITPSPRNLSTMPPWARTMGMIRMRRLVSSRAGPSPSGW